MARAGVPKEPIVHNYATAGNTATAAAFVTAAVSIVGASDEVVLHDTSAKDVYMAWSSTPTNTSATISTNCIAIPADFSGSLPFSIPSGSSIFLKGVSDTAGSGLLAINRLAEPTDG